MKYNTFEIRNVWDVRSVFRFVGLDCFYRLCFDWSTGLLEQGQKLKLNAYDGIRSYHTVCIYLKAAPSASILYVSGCV